MDPDCSIARRIFQRPSPMIGFPSSSSQIFDLTRLPFGVHNVMSLILFISEVIRMDVVALMVLGALAMFGVNFADGRIKGYPTGQGRRGFFL